MAYLQIQLYLEPELASIVAVFFFFDIFPFLLGLVAKEKQNRECDCSFVGNKTNRS